MSEPALVEPPEERIEDQLKELFSDEVAEHTMLGDLVSVVIDEMKAMPDVWQKLNQFDQQNLIDRVTRRVQSATRQAINIIASDNRKTAMAKVEKVEFKEGCKVTIIPVINGESSARYDMADAAGDYVMIVFAGEDHLSDQSTMPKAEPDQRALEIGEEE